MTDPEESKQYVGQSVDGDAAVDAMLRRRCQGAYASYPVANSNRLDNRGDGDHRIPTKAPAPNVGHPN